MRNTSHLARLLFFAATCTLFSASPSAAPTLYQLEADGLFTPASGGATSLSGTFTWADPTTVFDPNAGIFVPFWDATELYFQAGQITFRLDISPLNDCGTRQVPSGLGAPQWDFCERVNAFDSAGTLIEPGLYLRGGGPRGPEGLTRIVFPAVDLYRNYRTENQESLGQMAFSAVAVPEPGAWMLFSLSIPVMCLVHLWSWRKP